MSNVIMTTELRDKLVAHYEKVKEEVIKCKTHKDADSLCTDNEVHLGICRAAKALFSIEVYHCKWVRSKSRYTGGDFWTSPPMFITSNEVIILALQTRIDILKQFPQ